MTNLWKKTKFFLSRLRWNYFLFKLGRKNKNKTTKQIFTDYFNQNFWDNSETKSGDGSTLDYTKNLREQLPILIEQLKISSIIDAPCGDFHWFKEILLPDNFRYIGADIVSGLIEDLNKKYNHKNRYFLELDVINEKLPQACIWLCRDLIFHLPNKDISKIIDNFLKSEIQYLLITSHGSTHVKNFDTFTGGFRQVNLLNAPFRLPEPQLKIKDYIEGHPERYLFLYKKTALETWKSHHEISGSKI